MFRAIRRIMDEHEDVKAIYPIHMNPVVRETAEKELGGCDRIRIIEPLDVLDFHNFLSRSYLILMVMVMDVRELQIYWNLIIALIGSGILSTCLLWIKIF